MKIFINGAAHQLTETMDKTISQALALFLTAEQQHSSFAVALNGDFIGKANYPQTQLTTEDSIDVLFPIQGG